MPTRQKLVSMGIPTTAVATIVAAALLNPFSSSSTSGPVGIEKRDTHDIDVVFAVDTTGSMDGLLDGAKRTVWSIASHIKQTDPNANIRIGLVAYRDLGEEYVTKPFQLTTDLDAVYAELAQYTAMGGGDTPEDVDAAMADALKMSWRPTAKKLLFVVGDAPPAGHGMVPSAEQLARNAASKGITVNTIRCGVDSDTASSFTQIAALGGGSFSTISQNGGVQQVATPYDNRIAELSATIDSSALILGKGARADHKMKMGAVAAAPAAAKADRAAYYGAGGGAPRDKADLVDGLATGKMKLEDVKEAELPAELQGKDKGAIKAEVDRRAAQRTQAQSELEKLNKERADYLGKQKPAADDSFDASVKATVEAQIK